MQQSALSLNDMLIPAMLASLSFLVNPSQRCRVTQLLKAEITLHNGSTFSVASLGCAGAGGRPA